MQIQVDNMSFRYPSVNEYTLQDINLTFKDGESVAIIGQNGAGKTTLVKLLIGLLKPTKGKIMVDDMDTKAYTTAKIARRVGYVFQNPDDQIFNSDVYSEIEYSLKYMKWPVEKIRNSIREAVDITGIKEYLGEHPMNIPYSTRKFVSIASVLAMDTEVVIFDEPTAGQDARGIALLENIISYLRAKNKIVIVITHDMEFVVNNFTRIITMANGHVLLDGEGSTVFNNPDVLQEAKLSKPYVMQVKDEIGLAGDIMKRPEFVKAYIEQFC